MALKSDLQALLNVTSTISTDVNKLTSLKELLTAIDSYVSTKGASSIDVYFRGVNDTEYRFNLSTDSLKTVIETESNKVDTALAAKDAVTLLNAEITKLGGK